MCELSSLNDGDLRFENVRDDRDNNLFTLYNHVFNSYWLVVSASVWRSRQSSGSLPWLRASQKSILEDPESWIRPRRTPAARRILHRPPQVRMIQNNPYSVSKENIQSYRSTLFYYLSSAPRYVKPKQILWVLVITRQICTRYILSPSWTLKSEQEFFGNFLGTYIAIVFPVNTDLWQ